MKKVDLEFITQREGVLMTKQEFLNGLDKDNIAPDWVSQIKDETLPLVIWGCGDVADAVYKYLKKNGEEIADVWADSSWAGCDFHGMKALSRDEVIAKYPKFNVILGHSRYELGQELTAQIPQVNKVFYAFSIHYEQYDKVPYENIEAQADRFVNLCNIVEDEESVKNLMAYLNTKMTGDVSHILKVYNRQMSFYNNDVFKMSEHESFFDIGAYNGDTIKLFLEETNGRYDRIIALEPDDDSFLELNDYIARERLRNVITSKNGAWDRCEELQFKTGNEQISSVDTGDNILNASNVITIHADRIDYMFESENITFIKINYYEGITQAIKGCEGILKEQHPKLAMDVGFDIYKVLELAEYISSLNEGYRLYLRFNRAMSSTFTLYAAV